MTRRQILKILILSVLGLYIWYIVNEKLAADLPTERISLWRYREHIVELSEVIIPRTDTPGAKDAGVADYVLRVLVNCVSNRKRRKVIVGLMELENYSKTRFLRSFPSCSEEYKQSIVEYFENKGSFSNPLLNKIKRKIIGPSFFEIIKKLIVEGYCTSEVGAIQGLAYDFIPGDYRGCEEYFPNQKSWALN